MIEIYSPLSPVIGGPVVAPPPFIEDRPALTAVGVYAVVVYPTAEAREKDDCLRGIYIFLISLF